MELLVKYFIDKSDKVGRPEINLPFGQICSNRKSLFEGSSIPITSGLNCRLIRSHMGVVTAHGPVKLTSRLSTKATEATENI